MSTRMARIKKMTITSVDKDVEKLEFSSTTLENSLAIAQRVKHRAIK